MFDPLIRARLVHVEGSDTVVVPPEMGEVRADQMQGAPREQLCELGGRVCVDGETEVLTKAGWVRFDEYDGRSEIACYDACTDTTQWHAPSEFIIQGHEGEIYRAESRSASIACTMNHNLFVSIGGNDCFRLIMASSAIGRKYKVKKSAIDNANVIGPIEIPPTYYNKATPTKGGGHRYTKTIGSRGMTIHESMLSHWAEFLGWYISEGSVYTPKKSGWGIALYQLDHSRITPCLDALGIKYGISKDPRNGVYQIKIPNSALCRYLLEFGRGSNGVSIPKYCFDWPVELRRVLLHTLWRGDGTMQGGKYPVYSTISLQLASDVQQLAFSLGLDASISKREGSGTKLDLYIIRIMSVGSHGVNNKASQDWIEQYSGNVYCVTVPTRVFFQRRRNKIIAIGNCYDSLGSGRSSEDYHKNLLKQQHLSVYEHAWFSMFMRHNDDILTQALYTFGRLRGADVVETIGGLCFRFNVRHVYDLNDANAVEKYALFDCLSEFYELCARMNAHVREGLPMVYPIICDDGPEVDPHQYTGRLDEHACVSMYLQMSRGASHEQVRHRFAVSQRSTRYVDESLSPYVTHPVITKYMNDRSMINDDGYDYDTAVGVLSGALERAGVAKVHARKQARGAARSWLRTSLATEMIFTAPIWGWQHMIKMRMSDHADAEIRVLYNRVLDEMCVNEQVAPFFKKFKNYEKPAIDGCGMVIK